MCGSAVAHAAEAVRGQQAQTSDSPGSCSAESQVTLTAQVRSSESALAAVFVRVHVCACAR
eukprot:2214650-Pleurochrysis_carterae.AAC.1